MDRTICWWSAGAASCVATWLVLQEKVRNVRIYNIDVGSEHPDNERFRHDCEEWFGRSIRVLKSETYNDPWEVFDARKFLKGPRGAPCTIELKKKVREQWQRPTDIHVFGYTNSKREVERFERFVDQNPGMTVRAPLIEYDISKADCLGLVARRGIRLPAMYELGYQNNNCIGCVKGGMGYWNKIRDDFPDAFDRMARKERELGFALLGDKNGSVFLDELERGRGNYKAEDMTCSPNCATVDPG